MTEIPFNIKLDLVNAYVPAEDVTVVQENNLSVKFFFSITNRKKEVDLSSATNFVVSFLKPDGNLVLQSDAALVNGKVECLANPQAFTYVGKTYMQVQYKIGAATYNTRRGFMWVERGQASCQTVASTGFAPFMDKVDALSAVDIVELIDSKQTAENAQADIDLVVTPQLDQNTSNIGNLSSLQSTNKTSLVGAVNENVGKVVNLSRKTEWIDVRDYGFVGDGITDDSVAIQKAAAALPNKGKLQFPKVPFLMTKPINIPASDVEIDGGGSTLLWNGTDTSLNNSARFIGMFNIKGTVSTDVKTITSFNLKPSLNQYIAEQGGSVVLNNVTGLSAGDYVTIDIRTGAYNASLLNTTANVLTKILSISGNTVYLEYTNPFPFPGLLSVGTLKKVTPIQNVKIKNFVIIDNTALKPGWVTDPLGQYPDADRKNIVSGISLQYAENCIVENIEASNMKFPLVIAQSVCRVKVNDAKLYKPALIGGGEGYLVQFNNALYCEANRCYGIGARHVVDFTGSAHCHAKIITGYDTFSSTIHMHGAYEHDITFEDVIGKMGYASGTSFGNANMNVTYTRCRGQISGVGYTRNFRFVNCNLKIQAGVMTDVIFEDSDILWQATMYLTPDKRGDSIESRVEFKGGSLTFDNSQDFCVIKDYDSITISDRCVVSYIGILDGSTGGKDVIWENVKSVKITRSKIDGVKFRTRSTFIPEFSTITITAGATVSGNVVVTLDGVSKNIPVSAGDTATDVATKIRGTTFSGWTISGSTVNVNFTATTGGNKIDTTYNNNGTGATGTAITNTQGVDVPQHTMEVVYDDNEIICKYTGWTINTKYLTNAIVIGRITNNTFKKVGNNASVAAVFPYPDNTNVNSTIHATYLGNTFMDGALEVKLQQVGTNGTANFSGNILRDGSFITNPVATGVILSNNQIV